METDPLSLLSKIVAIVFAVSVHEFCHAWMADRLGDPTARMYGRLTLNPLKHFDFFGTLALFFIGFGWGKPVPFNEHNLANPRRDSALIALAGPMANLLTAVLCAIPIKYFGDMSIASLPIYAFVGDLFIVSVLLFSLNILPFPPFDGSKMIGVFVPQSLERAYQQFLHDGMQYVIFFVLFDTFFLERVFHISVLSSVMGKIASLVTKIIFLGS